MSYQPGRMGLAEGIALVFTATMSPVFLSLFSFTAIHVATSAWMVPAIACFEFFVILYALLYVLKTTDGDLFSACQQLVGTVATRLIALYYICLYLLDAGLLLRQYAENTLLTALPQIDFELVIAWYLLVIILILHFGIETISRGCSVLMPFVIFGLLVVMGLAIPRYNMLYLTPWNGTGLDQTLLWGLQTCGVNLGALLPVILAASFQNARTVRNAVACGLGLSTAIRVLSYAAYTAAFDIPAGREKVLPFFELARLVYINRFFQRIEAFFIVLWSVMGMLNIAIDLYAGLYLLCRLFNLPALRPLIAPAAVIIAQLAMLPGEVITVITLYARLAAGFYNLGTVLIPLILFATALYRSRRRKPCQSAG